LTRFFIVISEVRQKIVDRKTLEISNLQTMLLKGAFFWPKIRAILQKNRGPAETILHFFLCFFRFLGFFQSQALVFQASMAIPPLQKNHT